MTKEDLIGTTWQFNDTLIVGNLFVNKKYIFDVKIESDEQVSNSLFVEKGNEPQTIIDITAEFAQIYDSTWNERYKVFTILETKNLADEAVFMQFLTDNATRVKSVSLQNLKAFKAECDKIYGGGTSESFFDLTPYLNGSGNTVSQEGLNLLNEAVLIKQILVIKVWTNFYNIVYFDYNNENEIFLIAYAATFEPGFALISFMMTHTGLFRDDYARVQEKLISGTNIKTINGQRLLGSGDIKISSGTSITTATTEEIQALFVSAKLIEFTIDNVKYQAEDGMTWEQWASSKYNTKGFIYDGTSAKKTNTLGNLTVYIESKQGVMVKPTEKIINQHRYGTGNDWDVGGGTIGK